MAVCPKCGEDNPERARVCMMCGTILVSIPREHFEERKIVSVLFVDLVGFTARSHDADPEDVRAALTPYYRALRAEIERFGGTLEKFIGDAVMAVFGVPVAHEDDAHRAVKAALRITDAIAALNQTSSGPDLSIRAAVNTGEALVNLSARLETGEGIVAGDVVNTAARLQHEAPVNGVVVGDVTHRSTKDSIAYDALEPVIVKGKPDPIPLWRAVAADEPAGAHVAPRYTTPFIGRDFDLAALRTLFSRTLQESSLQLITVVGEPGVGKSRLLAEFSSYIDGLSQSITWRQGRSLPYGDGITFWALGEIVKAHAGIKESDSPQAASDKLATATAALEDDESERAWLQSRLAPLVGADASGRADQEESFTAWLRFFEAIASTGPLILVFEDLHWADGPLLEFIEHVVEWSTSVPILVICTARPELLDTHPTWAARSRNATTITLSPLSDSEIAQLISGLLSRVVLSAEIHTALLDRVGGNPLFAEEFVRMLSDRELLRQNGRLLALDSRADIPLPDNIQAIIASRLDSLSSEKKSLLHNAAVVGRVFWSGAVAAMAKLDDGAVRRSLQELVHTELVRPARTSSIDGQQEYSFWHALIRDVAYGQIPRPQRASRHLAAARWIEAVAGERVSDHAEILVHHYEEATKLLTSSGMTKQAADLDESTIRLLALAGDRAIDLDVERARQHYERAWRLLSPDDPKRPGILLKLGKAANQAGRVEEANTHFTKAIDLFRETGGLRGEADARLWLAGTSWEAGLSLERIRGRVAESIKQLEQLENRP
jgi:class 3 adenylate cyclase/tetratricopeptide (TPR) repeat protein